MSKTLITALSVVGILGTASVAFATNIQALSVDASQDVSGGGTALIPSQSPSAPATNAPAPVSSTPAQPGTSNPSSPTQPGASRTAVQVPSGAVLPGPAAPVTAPGTTPGTAAVTPPEVSPPPHSYTGGSGTTGGYNDGGESEHGTGTGSHHDSGEDEHEDENDD